MKRFSLVIALALALAPALAAQNHGELGVFFDYTRLANTSTNFYGIGGRVGFNVVKHVQLEAEMAYDFEQNLNCSAFASSLACAVVSPRVHLLRGMFGPKFQAGTKWFRPFFTVKGGAINFSTSSSFTTQFSQATSVSSGTDALFYPGGGVEIYAGPLGIRGEIGDEIWFSNGANHNLRIMVGPQIRF